jgi:hypothetical protein
MAGSSLDIEEATRQADALMQGAIDQFTKPLVIPSYKPIVIPDSINKTLDNAKQSREAHAKTVDESQKLFSTATQQEKEAIGQEGESKAALARSMGERSQQEAEGYQYFQRLFGMDMAPNAAIANAAEVQQELRETLPEKRDRINKLHATTLFDDPIEYILNAMELPAAISDYNTTVDKINSNQTAINEGIQSAKDAGELNNRGIPTITASMAAANANVALAEAARKKADADQNLATVSVDFATKKLTQDLALANATRDTTHLQLQQEELKYRSLVNAIQLADSHAARLQAAAKLTYEIADKAHLQQVILNQYDKNIGNPPGTTTVLLFNRLPQAQRDNITAIGSGSAGINPYEALQNITRIGPNLSPETGRLLSFISEKQSVIPPGVGVDKKVNDQRIAKILTEDIQKEMSNPSKSRIFKEMSPAKMLASNAVPAGSKLEQVLLPLTKIEGDIPTDTVISTIIAQYDNPTEAAAVVAAYYRANIDLRNKSINLGLVGMKPTDSYPVAATSFTFLNTPLGGSTQKYDLTKPEEALKYIIIQQTRDKILQGPSEGTDTNFIMPVGFESIQAKEGVEIFDDSNPPTGRAGGARFKGKAPKDIMPEVNSNKLETTRDTGIITTPPESPASDRNRPKRVKT